MAAQTLDPHAAPTNGVGTYRSRTSVTTRLRTIASQGEPPVCVPATRHVAVGVQLSELAWAARATVFHVLVKVVVRTRVDPSAIWARATQRRLAHESDVSVVQALGVLWST
jgi:hypothetical protein